MRESSDPRELQDIATEDALGEFHGQYRSGMGFDVVAVVATAVLGVVLLANSGGAGGIVAIGVGLLVLSALAAWTTWRKANTLRYVYANGMLLINHSGAVTSVVRWTDVAHLRIWVRVVNLISAYAEVLQCRLELHSGDVVDLAKPGYKDKPELVAFVEQQVAAAMYPARVEEVARTGVATFGPVTLTDDGVRLGGVLAAWSDITKVEFGKTKLKVWTDERRPVATERLKRVPDTAVLRHMLQHWPVVDVQEPDEVT